MSTPRVSVDETLSISRVTVADTAPRVVVSETGSTSGVQVTATSDVVSVVLSPTAAGVASLNGLTGSVTVQDAVTLSSTLDVPGVLSVGSFAQGGNNATGTFAAYAENPVFYGYNLTLGGLDSGNNYQGITFAGSPSGNAFLGYNDSTDRIVQSRNGTIYYDIPVSTTELAEGTNLYYTNARADARVAAGIAGIDYPVDSVNGATGTVVLTTSNIAEGSNEYYTTARVNSAFDTRLATKTTDNLTQGSTNRYFSNSLARGAISASGSLSYDSGTGVISYTTPSTTASLSNHTTDALSEGTTNLYYTNARADARVALGIANLVDSAPATLDTLNELAAALGDDANFSTTITTALGTKLATADFASTANTWLATKSTTNLAEGTNLYYTSTRTNSDFDTRLATKTTDNLSEGLTNLYYTDARVTTRINNTSIDALNDVVITTGTAGQMLYYNGTSWINSAAIDSANLARFSRTVTGTGSNTIVALSRNRTDAARATDSGPWLGFEYVGTDNTQATSSQNAIRSMYDSGGNHKLQFMQLPGSYLTPSIMAQLQRGNTFFNTTAGVSNLALTDSIARIGGTTTSITNSANTQTYASLGAASGNINQDSFSIRNNAGTTTYAQFLSTGTTITGAGLHQITRTTVGTPGVSENRPSFNIQLSRSDQAAPSNNDGTGFRSRINGSNGTNYTLTDLSSAYSTTGDTAWFLNLANGDQTGATFSGLATIQSKISGTTIRAGTPSATPGGSSVADKLVIDAVKISATVPVAFPVYTKAAANAITGAVGWQIAISDSAQGANPNGMMAFWDTSNSRWSYIHDNSAV
jgi:hypothetical protein